MDNLNFEQLKKEALIEQKNEYMSRISIGQRVNTPMLKILFDYFNILNDNKKKQKEQGIYVKGFVSARNVFMENLPERANGNINVKVVLDYKGEFLLFVVLSRYMVDGNWISEVSFTSNHSTYVNSEFLYKKLIYSGIAMSNLKGAYFTMPYNELAWEVRELTRRDYGDIYLPKTIMQDLELFTGLFEKKGEIMRYLLCGTPGTGKTESTLAISNILKNNGVTIIKTVVCDALKEKIELAELLAPTLIIFDDIDLSLGSRNKGAVSRSLGTFLDALDGTDKISNGVGIIATTNSIELLDLAAQRPGRFDKIMSFDSITKDNIKKIILKSLKYNFKFGKNHPSAEMFTNSKIIDIFYTSKLTGSHVYSSVRQIMRKVDTLGINDYDVSWIISEIKNELKTIDTIRNAQYLKNANLKSEAKTSTGFDLSEDDEEVEMVDEEYEKMEESSEEQPLEDYGDAPVGGQDEDSMQGDMDIPEGDK